MTSKNFLLADIKENLKRRLWLIGIAVLVFVILLPSGYLIALSSIDRESYTLSYGALAYDEMFNEARRYALAAMTASGLKISLTFIFAIAAALSAFSFLNNKVKVDFYMSMPKKKLSLFMVNWLGGVICYAIVNIVSLALCALISPAYGYRGLTGFLPVFNGYISLILFFIGVYGLMILAIMLTGNAFSSLCAFAVFSLYEICIRLLIYGYKDFFFKYFYPLEGQLTPIFGPYGMMYEITSQRHYGIYVFSLFIFDILLLILCIVSYMKRPMESAGKTLAFNRFKTPVKILITVPLAAAIGLMLTMLRERSYINVPKTDLVVILFMILSVLIICAVIQCVFEQDIKALFHKRSHMLVCAALSLALLLIFEYDPLKLDSRLPGASSIKSAAFVPDGYMLSSGYIDKNYIEYMDGVGYCMDHMFMSNISDVLSLSYMSMNSYDAYVNGLLASDRSSLYDEYSQAVILFRLKSGRTVARKIYVPVHEDAVIEKLCSVIESEDFINGYFPIMQTDYSEGIDKMAAGRLDAGFTDGVYSFAMSKDDLHGFIEEYRKDLLSYSYKDVRDELFAGYVTFGLDSEPYDPRNSYFITRSVSLPVSMCMKHSLEYLYAKGYTKECFLDPKDVSYLTVSDFHRIEYDEYMKDHPDAGYYDPYYDPYDDFSVTRTYTGSDLDKICAHLYPVSEFSYRWDGGKGAEQDYTVQVVFKADTQQGIEYGEYGANYVFIEGEVPENVRRDLEL